MEYAKTLLDEIGLGAGRIEMYHIGASDALLWAEKVSEMTERVRGLGPNPLNPLAARKGPFRDQEE